MADNKKEAQQREIQRVKIGGFLFNLKLFLGIIRDVLFIMFLAVGIFGIISLVFAVTNFTKDTSLQDVLQEAVSGVTSEIGGGLVGGQSANLILQSFDTLETDYKKGDTSKALSDLAQLEILSKQFGASQDDLKMISELRQAITTKNDQKFYQIMGTIKK